MAFYDVTALDTVPIDVKRVIGRVKGSFFQPLTNLVDAVEQLPFERQEVIAHYLCAVQEAVHPPIARRISRQLEQAKADGDFAVQLVCAALSIAELTAYALRLPTDSAYTLGTAWWHALGFLHDPARSIREGIFAIERTLFEERTPLWEVAKRPILVTTADANRFLRPRPPSQEQLRRVTREIVEEFERENPGEGQKIPRDDFIEMVTSKLACSKAWGKRAWENYAPKPWHRHGPRPGPRRR
jgi:hypothetical protein